MCEHLNIDDHDFIVCGVRGAKKKFCSCGRVADFLCDWKVAEKRSGTCDAPICRTHAKEVAPEKNLCQVHAAYFAVWKRNHPDVDVSRSRDLEAAQLDLFPGIL